MNSPQPPQLNAHGGFGGEVGPTHGTLSPRPDQVINNLSNQLTCALDLLKAKRKELDELKMELRARLKDEPLTFLKIDLLNLIDPPK